MSTKELRRINKLGRSSLIRLGERLKIPVNKRNLRLTKPEAFRPKKPWHKYAAKDLKHGYLTLQSLGRKWKGQVRDKKGNILPSARKRLKWMLASWRTGRQIELSPRLLKMLVNVSDEFGGRPIRIVSGYRERSHTRHSKHGVGRALDFSIPGVPNSALVDYLLTLKNTGVGYYPNSTHVHLDVRTKRMYWVDASRPGQQPRYVHKSATGKRVPVASNKSATGKRVPVAANKSKGRPRRSSQPGSLAVASLGPQRR